VAYIPTKQLEGYEQAYLMRVFTERWGPGVGYVPTYSVISDN
jgi:hypothetical protein